MTKRGRRADHGKRGEEARLWEVVTKQAKPLPAKLRAKSAKAPLPEAPVEAAPKPRAAKVAKPPAPKPPAPRPTPPLPPLAPGRAIGLDRSTHEKLRQGAFAIEGRLDLHGHTLETAHRALARFIDDSAAHGRRRLLVITGKGARPAEEPGIMRRATLREKVPLWLNEAKLRPLILAVEPAQPKHGGAGAFYVLLRRAK